MSQQESQQESPNTNEQESSENLHENTLHSSSAESAVPEEVVLVEADDAETNEIVSSSVESGQGNEESPGEEQSAKHQAHHQHFNKFITELEKLSESEAKLQLAIDFMEASLAQSGTPHFKSFWEARTICLGLFKENINPVLRAALWAKYNELSKEARRLKEILDEQSAFAVEQIEMAVKALEDDITAFDENLHKVNVSEFEVTSQALTSRVPHYQDLQRKLNLLNTHASRINALRKELIRTEMRVRQKNKFFQRLSAAGDKVFPVRKNLIKEVSDSFIADVDSFIGKYFTSENFQNSLFSLREEIKALQNMAKILTLNTHSFTHTRMRLSECWDRIKNEEKERKKERAQLKATFKQSYDESLQKIRAFKDAYAAEPMSNGEAMKQLEEISAFVRGLELGRDERQALREEWNIARNPVLEKVQAEEQSRLQQEQDRENQRRNKMVELRQQVDALLKNGETLDVEAIIQQRDEIVDKVTQMQISKAEKQDIERQLKPLRDLISEKKESSLLTLSEDDREALLQLREVLKQRKTRRQEVKDQIDLLRKASAASGFDFEQAMNLTAQLATEKERLDKINQGILEVEHKIAELVNS